MTERERESGEEVIFGNKEKRFWGYLRSFPSLSGDGREFPASPSMELPNPNSSRSACTTIMSFCKIRVFLLMYSLAWPLLSLLKDKICAVSSCSYQTRRTFNGFHGRRQREVRKRCQMISAVNGKANLPFFQVFSRKHFAIFFIQMIK